MRILIDYFSIQVVFCLIIEAFLVDRGLIAMMNSKWWLKMRPREEKYLEVEKKLSNSDWPLVSNCSEEPTPPQQLSTVQAKS